MHRAKLRVVRPIRVQTEHSVWYIDQDTYRREYRSNPNTESIDGALDFDVEHSYREMWYEHYDWPITGYRIRIIPTDRPSDAEGILTGYIVSVATV